MSDEKIIVQIDPDLEGLIPGFLGNRLDDIAKLQSALNENDFVNISSLGHSIKGVGGGYGFDLMSELGENIETAGKDSDVEVIRDNINRLDDYLKCVEVEYA